MKLSVSSLRIENLKSPLTIVPILEGEQLPYQKKGMIGKEGKLHLSWEGFKGNKKILFVGLGKKKDLDLEKIRKAFGSAVKSIQGEEEEFAVLHRTLPGIKDSESAKAMLEGIVLGAYCFDKYKTKKDDDKEVKTCTFVFKGDSNVLKETALVCENVNLVRSWVNENADVMTTQKIASLAKDIARKNRMKIKIFEREQLKKLGCNLILAVGSGSRYPPKMIVIEYKGSSKKETIALLGKGITFDSGGINLKPSGYIETMKVDMSGAATVLGVMKSIAELKLKVNVTAVVPTCENMIGPDSYKPGDVITSYSGKTVEVENTDAEGRLILGDALAWAERNIKPSQMIDIASLTGAALVIFGEYATPFIGEGKYKKQLVEAGRKTHEQVWELPLYEEFNEEVKGDIADIRNLGYNKRYAGTIMGAAFLKSFVETPLLHLDIGGTAWFEKPRGYVPKNATGVGVRLLVEFFRTISR